jgi:hypothetical protein
MKRFIKKSSTKRREEGTHEARHSQPCQEAQKAEGYNSLVLRTGYGWSIAVAAVCDSIAI